MLSRTDDSPPTAAGPAAPAGSGSVSAVRVAAPARLHLGFLDPSATLGRPFGSLGLAIDGFATEVELAAAAADRLDAGTPAARAEIERAAAHLDTLRQRTGRRAPLSMRLLRSLPVHAGFGSGTQLALAVGRAFARLHGLAVDTPTLAGWLGRGLRSGVGIAAFDAGGLLLDGGPMADGRPAPLLSRVALPDAWRVVVVVEDGRRGLEGQAERDALARLPPLPRAAAADLCHHALMGVLPGAAGDDFDAFATGLNRIQQVLGEHFAPAQGGSAWTSPAIGRLMAHWQQAGAGRGRAAFGQSSWGPTAFAIVASANDAAALIDAARQAGHAGPPLSLHVVTPRRSGATLTAAAP